MPTPCTTIPGTTTYTCPVTLANGDLGLIVWDSSYGPNKSGSYAPPSGYNTEMDMYGNVTSGISSSVTIGYAPILLEATSR
jgi:hypothetical protein